MNLLSGYLMRAILTSTLLVMLVLLALVGLAVGLVRLAMWWARTFGP